MKQNSKKSSHIAKVNGTDLFGILVEISNTDGRRQIFVVVVVRENRSNTTKWNLEKSD